MQFNGLWIPSEILNYKELSIQEKFILSMILSLSKERGYCFASNEYFAKIMNISANRSSKILSSIRKKKYIDIKLYYKSENNKVGKRQLIPKYENIKIDWQKSQHSIGENDNTYGYNGQANVVENDKYIINNYNNIIKKNNRKSKSKVKYFHNINNNFKNENERQYDFNSFDFLYANPQN